MPKILIVLFLCITAACDLADSRPVAEPYAKQITALRHENIDLVKKCQDLRKEIANLETQQDWNNARLTTVAGEALVAAQVNPNEFVVNVDRLTIERRHK